jgi:glycine oxidase
MKTCDVAIIGAGIIGATVAFKLRQAGLRVALLDRSEPGGEASWAAAGMLSPAPDSPEGRPLVDLANASLTLYPSFIAEIEAASGGSAELRRDGAMELFFGEAAELMRDAYVAEHRGFGLATEAISVSEARRVEPSIGPSARAAAWLPYECTLAPRAFLSAALAAAISVGVEILPRSDVTGIEVRAGRVTGITLRDQTVATDRVVVATGAFTSRIPALARYAPIRPVRGQMLALRQASTAPAPRLVLRSSAGYVVPRKDGTVVAGSTLEDAGFEKAVTTDGERRILNSVHELAATLASATIIERWSGLRPCTPDHLPILGPCDISNLFFAVGHYRNGILLAPITAALIAEWVAGRKPSIAADLFSPMRFATPSNLAAI